MTEEQDRFFGRPKKPKFEVEVERDPSRPNVLRAKIKITPPETLRLNIEIDPSLRSLACPKCGHTGTMILFDKPGKALAQCSECEASVEIDRTGEDRDA